MGQKKIEHEYKNPDMLPKVNDAIMVGTIKANEELLRSYFDIKRATLAYIIRKNIVIATYNCYHSIQLQRMKWLSECSTYCWSWMRSRKAWTNNKCQGCICHTVQICQVVAHRNPWHFQGKDKSVQVLKGWVLSIHSGQRQKLYELWHKASFGKGQIPNDRKKLVARESMLEAKLGMIATVACS